MSEIRLTIKLLPYKKGIIKPFEGDDKEECSICMSNDQFTYKNWAELRKCKHSFHHHCIDLWLEKHRTCPICVQDVDDDNDENNENNRYPPIATRELFFSCMCGIFLIASSIVAGYLIFYYYVKR
jgi:hypothetical protein